MYFPGNLGRVDYISEFEYDLFIRPDTCNPRYRVWFCFTVENVKADQVCWQTVEENGKEVSGRVSSLLYILHRVEV